MSQSILRSKRFSLLGKTPAALKKLVRYA